MTIKGILLLNKRNIMTKYPNCKDSKICINYLRNMTKEILLSKENEFFT